MESRNAILQAIAEHRIAPVDLPEPVKCGIQYDDPFAQFSTVLKAVGGAAFRVPDFAAARDKISQLDVVQKATRIYSSVPELVASNVDLDATETPQELQDLDLAVFSGQLAVAENAAVWATDAGLRHRAVYFIAEHVIFLVPSRQLVHNMHEAYENLTFGTRHFGAFFSGPSKTADIEQSLVIGAQGARSLHVVLIDEFEAAGS